MVTRTIAFLFLKRDEGHTPIFASSCLSGKFAGDLPFGYA